MTMSLAKGLSTISTKKRKAKPYTQKELTKLAKDHVEYNKSMRVQGRLSERMSFEDYQLYRQGLFKPKVQESVEFNEYVMQKSANYRETKQYPSRGDGVGVATKKEPPKYTGTLIKGISQMHKSNAVPVIDEQQIIDIRHMRR